MTSKYFFSVHVVESLLTNRPEVIIQLFVLRSRVNKNIATILSLAHQQNIKVELVSADYLQKIALTKDHQGVVAMTQGSVVYDENVILPLLAKLTKPPLFLLLDGVQDPHNLGACLRSANAAGVDAVVVPKDRAASLTSAVSKVACGAAEVTPLIAVTNLARTISLLQANGVWVYGATAATPKSIYEVDLSGSVAVVLGGRGERFAAQYADKMRLLNEDSDGWHDK